MCDVFSITKLRLILFSKSYKFDLGFPNMKECTSGPSLCFWVPRSSYAGCVGL